MKSRKRAGPNPFQKNLRALMTEKEVTVRRAADVAKVSPSTIDDWRAGALPENYQAVKRLAEFLNVSFSFLLTGEEDRRSSNALPAVTEVFEDGGELFDGYAKITIQRLLPRKAGSK